ncbi:hypothetical protein BDV25DRAFT_140603 [Aspergillus avenaceus]|uniref:P-loop containing nucleoside triphosphate hydrolase protein n=1 Tax=Aspergillus avenaceus TaxID=36643 RepID=A0A5N6TTL4_ASPAV|nr:hypothetical protein BDV25DRAFT_140603 [Aspergillus avenaceus]
MALSNDSQSLRLAELHYIAEQSARHFRIWEGQAEVPPCPNFKILWPSVTTRLRQTYLARAQSVVSGLVREESAPDYEAFLKTLYKNCFANITQDAAETMQYVPLLVYEEQLNQSKAKSLVDSYQSLGIQSHEDKLDSQSDNSQYADEPNDCVASFNYDFKDNEDPIISSLEAAVKDGTFALEDLQKVLTKQAMQKGDMNWVNEIKKTLSFAQTEKVIIGVVGSTGAGKSSLINAIADEENILATNCMRASTAVATELAYNDGKSRYKAQIEYIQRDEWEQELEILFGDLLDNREAVIRGDLQKSSDAAVALDKLKALYPLMKLEDILNSSLKDLVEHSDVLGLLGSVSVIEENSPREFAKKLKSYIDSKGRARSLKKPLDKDSKDSGVRNWPLIRVVRIYVKAKALSTGAVLVDLPGVFDSNAARVAVAEEYMKRCSAHWIVSPINRAVDDKVARDLLGQNMKLQMHMDCAFNDITFVCTKTDEISIGEVQDSLRLNVPSVQERELRERQRVQLEAELKRLEIRKEHLMDSMGMVDDEIEELESRLTCGEHSFDLSQLTPSKRKHFGDTDTTPANCSNDISSGTWSAGSSLNETTAESKELLEKVWNLRSEHKVLRSQRRNVNEQIECRKTKLVRLQEEYGDIQAVTLKECIEARNNYSKHEIKKDFSNGIRDLDEELEGVHDDTSQPEETRDYKKLEDELPVFCVSTKGYQKLCGRLKKETSVSGFANIEETEIPQLQLHCISLTKKAREASSRRFLTRLKQLLQSLILWCSANNSINIMSTEGIQELEAKFAFAITAMKETMISRTMDRMSSLQNIFLVDIINRLDPAVNDAIKELPHTVSRWNTPHREGGLHFQTYKATCRREGKFRETDWNQDLASPILQRIVAGWTKTFTEKVPRQLAELGKDWVDALQNFHEAVIVLAEKSSFNDKTKRMLEEAQRTYHQCIEQELIREGKAMINDQKKVNRLFCQKIQDNLSSIYAECAAERGKGTSMRMKNLMTSKVDEHVLRQSASRTSMQLMNLLKTTEAFIREEADKVVGLATHDYRNAIIDPRVRKLSADQIDLKRHVHNIIVSVEAELNLKELLRPRKEHLGQSTVCSTVVKNETEAPADNKASFIKKESIWDTQV